MQRTYASALLDPGQQRRQKPPIPIAASRRRCWLVRTFGLLRFLRLPTIAVTWLAGPLWIQPVLPLAKF